MTRDPIEHTDVVFMTEATAKPDKLAEVRRALVDVAVAARAQPGCVDYRILRSVDDPTVTINAERWESVAHRDAFLAGADAEKFAAAVSGGFAGPPQPLEYAVVEAI